MKRPATLTLIGLLVTAASVPWHASGQVPAGAVAVVIEVTGDVKLQTIGTKKPVLIKGKEALELGARLVAASDGASVLLQCANGGSQLLDHMFDAEISRSEPQPNCAIDLNDGDAFATSNPDAGDKGVATINDKVGLTGATSHHTQFGVSVHRGDPGATRVFVIEGEATVRQAKESRLVSSGQMYVVRSAELRAVPTETYSSLAASLARIDLQRAGDSTNAASFKALSSSYENALRKPNDPEARKALGEQYRVYKIPESPITRYNALKMRAISQVPPGGFKPVAPNIHTENAAVAAVATNGPVFPARTFQNPSIGKFRLEYCLHEGNPCGIEAANEFCRRQGFKQATTFKEALDIGKQGPTLIVGDNKLCRADACDGFASIVCQ